MRQYTKANIYLISEPKLNIYNIGKFLNDNDTFWKIDANIKDADKLIEFCSRICYVSFGNKQGRETKEYIENIISSGHGSVLEHLNYTFLITNCSRGFTHELIRHRAGFAYSQESTHYINYDFDTFTVNIPQKIKEYGLDGLLLTEYKNIANTYDKLYKELLKNNLHKKEACSLARQILPTGIEAKIIITGNLRAWRHFIETRANNNNVQEIHDIAVDIYKILNIKTDNGLYGMELRDDEIISKYKKV